MTDSTVTGYAARAAGQPLEPYTYRSPELGEHDVRVAVTHCGLCYTDIHGIDNYYGISDYPFVPGHEIVGHVAALGRAVTGLKEGDRVGIGWQGRSCGECEWCRRGQEQLCLQIAESGTWKPYGGFAASVVADGRFAYPLPGTLPAESAAVLMCAGISVYAPLRAHAEPGRRVGVLGIGGLGHLAIQFARALDCDVTAISSSAAKQDQALALGAHRFVATEDPDALARVEDELDLLLCTAHGRVEWGPLWRALKRRGKVVLVGFPEMTFNPTDLVAHELSVTGSFIGSRATMKEMLAFAGEHGIRPWTETMPMARVNEAIERLKKNRVRYRIVLANDE
jgi:uncharacterized zinc-type alcohol dehydrogenase-like protein